jgi:hypothetical protein
MPAWWPDVLRAHAAGVEFKLHPYRTTASWTALFSEQERLTSLGREVWLWVESCRLHHRFATVRDYATSPINKCPEARLWRSCLANARVFGAAFLWKNPRRDPRERLLHALALLLWEPWSSDRDLFRRLQEVLGARCQRPEDLVNAYYSLWRRFSG